ncbi:hypothetical protein VTN00DRAFT_3472 [Thermoascus crustaceus]|uniref:uncharacterized protein n=1 Tax=Thermoascus crustaceus TaxID=5088 RepID=UPI0037438909
MNFTVNCSWPDNWYFENATPCGLLNSSSPVIPCCVAGDRCMTDNICSYSYSETGGSGYYTAGCTNGGFLNPLDGAVCSDRCGDTNAPDIVYNNDSGLWHCCGVDANNTLLCPTPTDETFKAAAPDKLIEYWSAGATTATTASSQATAAATATNSPPHAATSSSGVVEASSGLSTGAKAGIGVGVAVGVIIVLAMGIIFFLRGRRKSEQPAREETTIVPGEGNPLAGNPYVNPSELPGDQNHNVHELAG